MGMGKIARPTTPMKPRRDPFPCPVCGEDVPAKAKSCPECGACDKSGWSPDAGQDGLDLPEDEEDFDYDKFLEQEFGQPRTGVPRLWWVVALVVLFAFLAMTLHVFVLSR